MELLFIGQINRGCFNSVIRPVVLKSSLYLKSTEAGRHTDKRVLSPLVSVVAGTHPSIHASLSNSPLFEHASITLPRFVSPVRDMSLIDLVAPSGNVMLHSFALNLIFECIAIHIRPGGFCVMDRAADYE